VPRHQADDYLTQLIKYIPSEIVAAFLTIDATIRSSNKISTVAYWMVFITLLILTPLYIWRVTSAPNKPPATAQIIISTISFAVWVFAIGGPFARVEWYDPVYAALLLPIYTVAAPIIAGRTPIAMSPNPAE
jgi:hypothetical protein